MLCEYAYYKTESQQERPCCNNKYKLEEDNFFKEKCPLVYYCTINERFENTSDMFKCKYRLSCVEVGE